MPHCNREQVLGVTYLLPPCVSWDSNSGCQAWWQSTFTHWAIAQDLGIFLTLFKVCWRSNALQTICDLVTLVDWQPDNVAFPSVPSVPLTQCHKPRSMCNDSVLPHLLPTPTQFWRLGSARSKYKQGMLAQKVPEFVCPTLPLTCPCWLGVGACSITVWPPRLN